MNLEFESLFGISIAWWWALPLLVFFARIMDVSLGTLRVLFVSRGLKLLAPAVGFFEVLIWITAIAQIIRDLDNFLCYFAYAGGYALGTFVGLQIEERLAMGMVAVRIITQREADELVGELLRQEFGVTCVDAQGRYGRVKIIFTIVRRRDLRHVLKTVGQHQPKAFYTVEDIRTVGREAWTTSPAFQRPVSQPMAAPNSAALSAGVSSDTEQTTLSV